MSQIRIQIRGHQLGTAQELGEAADGVFIPLSEPPPVRSFLQIHEDGQEPRALEVVRVIEIEDTTRGQTPGVVGRYIGLDELRAGQAIGTEHLEGGIASTESEGPTLAVPAPVVDPDPSNAIAVDELERLEAASAANDDGTDDGPDNGNTDGESGQSKKRRGRKRR